MSHPATELRTDGGSLRVLLVAEESAGVQALKLLAASPLHVVGVMASPERREVLGPSVWQAAEKVGCQRWPAELVMEQTFRDVVVAERIDLLLNIHSLHVIHPAVLSGVRRGAFNLHPGPLPRYAGLNAPSWAIYREENVHGVTLHWMESGIDTGPIAYQAPVEIEASDTGLTLSAKCAAAGLQLLREFIQQAAAAPNAIPARPQDLSQREYFGKGTPHDGWIDWSRPARAVHCFVRAADYSPFRSPWRTPRSCVGEQELGFAKVALTGQRCQLPPGTIAEMPDGSIRIACGDEWLSVASVSVGGKKVAARECLRAGQHLGGGGSPSALLSRISR